MQNSPSSPAPVVSHLQHSRNINTKIQTWHRYR